MFSEAVDNSLFNENMKKFKDKKQFRYKGYDYSQSGTYFITICTKNREIFFGDTLGNVDNATMELSKISNYILLNPNKWSLDRNNPKNW